MEALPCGTTLPPGSAGRLHAAQAVREVLGLGLLSPVLVYRSCPELPLEPQQDAKMGEQEHKVLRFICSLRWTWQVGGRSC